MPSKSAAQARLMAACSHGAGYASCPPAKVAKEFNRADRGRHFADGGFVDTVTPATSSPELEGTASGALANTAGPLQDFGRGAVSTALASPIESALHPLDVLRALALAARHPVVAAQGALSQLGHQIAQAVHGDPRAMGELAGSLVPTPGPGGALREMTTYHGTHHTFKPTPENPLGEFSLDKVGTGQGAQAFGHGIYVAENPEVAKMYRRGAPPVVMAGDQKYDTMKQDFWREDPQSLANKITQWAADTSKGNPFNQMPGLLERLYRDKYNAISPSAYEGAKKIMQKWRAQNAIIQPGGSLYHAELPDTKVSRMLKWEGNLNEQPKNVQNAFRRAWMNRYDEVTRRGQEFPQTGEDIYNFLGPIHTEKYDTLSPDRAASSYLADEGVPGLSYLDGRSRLEPAETRNFVLFDPSIARIIRKEAKGGLIKGSGAIHSALRGYAEGGLVKGGGAIMKALGRSR